MTTLNQMQEAVGSLPLKPTTMEEDLLGVYEAVTKLWIATVVKKKDASELTKRIANLFVGTSLLAQRFHINLETAFTKRVNDLQNEFL